MMPSRMGELVILIVLVLLVLDERTFEDLETVLVVLFPYLSVIAYLIPHVGLHINHSMMYSVTTRLNSYCIQPRGVTPWGICGERNVYVRGSLCWI